MLRFLLSWILLGTGSSVEHRKSLNHEQECWLATKNCWYLPRFPGHLHLSPSSSSAPEPTVNDTKPTWHQSSLTGTSHRYDDDLLLLLVYEAATTSVLTGREVCPSPQNPACSLNGSLVKPSLEGNSSQLLVASAKSSKLSPGLGIWSLSRRRFSSRAPGQEHCSHQHLEWHSLADAATSEARGH